MIIEKKYKICKRLGSAVFEKCQTQKFRTSAEKHTKRPSGRGGRGGSEYGRQLIEKQKLRYTYGITERQLSRYVQESLEVRGTNPSAVLLARLESRLDNVVYRLGLAHTRQLARQMVSHGHITVNGRKLSVASHQVRPNDVISVREGSKKSVLFAGVPERLQNYSQPAWLTFDAKDLKATIRTAPSVEGTDAVFDIGGVLEFYSR